MIDLLVSAERAAALESLALQWPSYDLLPQQLSDLDLLVSGALAPLDGFMRERDYASVLANHRLASGEFWPFPIVLDIDADTYERLRAQPAIALRDREGVMIAALHVEDTWQRSVGQLRDDPIVRRPYAIGGRVEGVRRATRPDFRDLQHAPAGLRSSIGSAIAIQPRSLLERQDLEFVQAIAARTGAAMLVQVLLGADVPERADYTRILELKAAMSGVSPRPILDVVTAGRRLPGWRDLVWRAIVARNSGCHALAVTAGEYAEFESDRPPLPAERIGEEIGVTIIPIAPPAPATVVAGRTTPAARRAGGFTVFFSGLSGSGKSTIANELRVKLLEGTDRTITLLDGDLVRKHLSSELGFSRAHRDINVRRIGFVAAQITKHGGIAICAPIAPYAAIRAEVREMVTAVGGFVLVHVATSLAVCEQRDRKGLYARARAGLVPEFTGVSDPYEIPADAEVVIDGATGDPAEAADKIIEHLTRAGLLTFLSFPQSKTPV